MVSRDILTEIAITKKDDGMGGFEATERAIRDIYCRVSNVSAPEILNMYGQHGEDVLHVFSATPLNANNLYMFNNKRYTIRKLNYNNRLASAILVEIK